MHRPNKHEEGREAGQKIIGSRAEIVIDGILDAAQALSTLSLVPFLSFLYLFHGQKKRGHKTIKNKNISAI